MNKILKSAVASLPPALLLPILRSRRNLTYSLPPNTELIWPWYLGDVKVHINSSNAIEHWMFRDYQEGIGQNLNLFVKPGYYCIDVGANVGAVTVMMAKYVGPQGKVLSFEPGPPYLARLKSNIELNPGMEKIITVVQLGLSDTPGELTWTADEDHPYNAVLVDGLAKGTGIKVPITTLDTYMADASWPKLDFLKVDVESMELEVLRGASDTLTRFKPTVVFETYSDFRMSRGFDIFKACEDLMRGLGYKLYSMNDAGKLIEVTADTMTMDTIGIHSSKPATLPK